MKTASEMTQFTKEMIEYNKEANFRFVVNEIERAASCGEYKALFFMQGYTGNLKGKIYSNVYTLTQIDINTLSKLQSFGYTITYNISNQSPAAVQVSWE